MTALDILALTALLIGSGGMTLLLDTGVIKK
jgi:hypothetical protein